MVACRGLKLFLFILLASAGRFLLVSLAANYAEIVITAAVFRDTGQRIAERAPEGMLARSFANAGRARVLRASATNR